jgi:hypothetical protein
MPEPPIVIAETLEANPAGPKETANCTPPPAVDANIAPSDTTLDRIPPVSETSPVQISIEEALVEAANKEPAFNTTEGKNPEHLYCPECYLPLHPDPKPERLYIFLHALKYTTSLGEFSTDMPQWADEGWSWDRT